MGRVGERGRRFYISQWVGWGERKKVSYITMGRVGERGRRFYISQWVGWGREEEGFIYHNG